MNYGVGTDIVSVSRCEEKLRRNPGMYARVCGPGEQAPSTPREFARVFAIKESCIKAQRGAISFKDITVSQTGGGVPEITWCADAALSFQVSVSYSQDTVVAVALCFKDGAN